MGLLWVSKRAALLAQPPQRIGLTRVPLRSVRRILQVQVAGFLSHCLGC